MITFAHPAYLWGLAGLAIPVAIHLLSRREGKVVLVGSVRHLEPSATRQFRTLKLNEMLLLLVRCILYSLIVLWFSGPVFTGWQTRTRAAWVEPSVATSPYTTSLLTQLDGRGFERQPWSQAWDSLTYPDVLKEMLLQPADSVVVIARGNARRFSGPRAVLPAHVQWIHPPQDSVSRFVVQAIATARDSVQIREGITNGEQTQFTTEMLTFTSAAARLNSANEVSVRNADTLRIHIAADEKYAEEARLLRAVLQSIDDAIPAHIVFVSQAATWTCWLRDDTAPNGDHVIVRRPDTQAGSWTKEEAHRYRLTKPLTAQLIREEDLVFNLVRALTADDAAQLVVTAHDSRVVDPQLVWQRANEPVRAALAPDDNVDRILLLLMLALLLTERWLAHRKNL